MEKGFGGKVFDTSGTIIKVFDFFLHYITGNTNNCYKKMYRARR